MNKVVQLLEEELVTAISIRDILEFVSLYPEWLSRCEISWELIVQSRNHIFYNKNFDNNAISKVLTLFFCDLIQLSLANKKVFEPFILTNNGAHVYYKYQGAQIDITDFRRIRFNFVKILREHELSGVAFLLNILKEINESHD